jgi:hypothetical protein
VREPKPVNPLAHVVHRFPLCLAHATLSSHQGGIALPEWLPALAGFCEAYGVSITVDDDRRGEPNSGGAFVATLRWQDRTAFVKKDARALRMEMEDGGAALDAMADVMRDASLLNLEVSVDGNGRGPNLRQ